MAVTENLLLQGMSGAIGKQLVFKHYSYGTVVTRYPDMSGVKPSRQQKKQRAKFEDTVKYAKGILADAGKKAEYQKKIGKGRSVYHAAIGEYMGRKV